MSSLVFAEIAATCNALGYSDGAKYFTDPQCLEAVKDLIRYLRRDDENHAIRRHLGEAKIVQTDLLLILKDHWEQPELFDHVLRLLVNLTFPALVLFNAELPEDKTTRYYYLQIISHLQSYKEGFINEVVWAVLCKKLGELLNIEWQDRSEDQSKVIERVLTLVRNVLQVPADTEAEKRPDNDATIHDQVLWALYQSGMVDLLHYIISSKHEDKFHMHVLEIISQMLRDQNPSFLAKAEAQRSIVEKTKDEAELLTIRQREAQERHNKIEKYTGLRDIRGEKPRIKNYLGSRFAGTYVVKNVKSISNSDMIYHKPLATLTALDLGHDKQLLRKPKNKRGPTDTVIERRSTLGVRLFLKEFCIEFLNGAYNTLMYSVKEMIHHGKNQANDESYYLWAMKFFMEFNRNYKSEMKLISETMSVSSFHFIQTQIENYQEMMLVDKKKTFVWSRRMHLALRAYQELLLTLGVMDHSSDSGVRESARIIKSNVFYVVEYRELILWLMVNFDDTKFSKSFLKDLIETVHIFLKLLENFCTRSRGIVVQEKRKVRQKKQKKSLKKNIPAPPNPEEIWNDLEPTLTTAIESGSGIPDDIVPFDSTSDVPIDDQKIEAVKKIQTALRGKQVETALGLLRASREVWPENDSFGAPNPAAEEEVIALREIYFADLGQPFESSPPLVDVEEGENQANEEEDEEEEEEDDHGGREIDTNIAETTFKFMDFVERFCNSKVTRACGLLLRDFEHNTMKTNHCVLKLLHRIAWDCKLPDIVFQASIFRTFQKILESVNSEHKELKKFAVFIIRKFVEVAQQNPKVYLELLFWKSSKEAYEVQSGYGSYQAGSQASKMAWSEEEEDELRRLYEEYLNLPEKPVDGDIVDWILRNLISDDRSRRGVSKKMREMGFPVPTSKPARKSVNTRPPVEWSPEEEEQLTALFHQFKNAHDPLGFILDRLGVKRPKARVVEKLLTMGLVNDKKDLRKKRAKKNQNQGQRSDSDESDGNEPGGDDEIVDSDSDSGTESSAVMRQTVRHNSSNKRKSRSTHPKASKFSQSEATRLLGQVRSAGMTEALKWLAESFEDMVEDCEDGSEESTPLLPLTEECMLAMESPSFQQFLIALGVNPPADEQESYWRVPGHFNAEELRARKDICEQQPTPDTFFNTEDLDQQVAEECRKIISENPEELESESELEASTLSFLETPKSVRGKKLSFGTDVEDLGRDNEQTVSDAESLRSDSILPTPSHGESNEGETSKEKKRKKRKLKVMEDSSDGEEESPMDIGEEEIQNNEAASSKRMLDSDSESESPQVKKHRRVKLLHDDEDED